MLKIGSISRWVLWESDTVYIRWCCELFVSVCVCVCIYMIWKNIPFLLWLTDAYGWARNLAEIKHELSYRAKFCKFLGDRTWVSFMGLELEFKTGSLFQFTCFIPIHYDLFFKDFTVVLLIYINTHIKNEIFQWLH